MDTVERYREIVGKLIHEYASYKPSHGQIETEAVIDFEREHYEVMHVGWDGPRWIHGSVVHSAYDRAWSKCLSQVHLSLGRFTQQLARQSCPVCDRSDSSPAPVVPRSVAAPSRHTA